MLTAAPPRQLALIRMELVKYVRTSHTHTLSRQQQLPTSPVKDDEEGQPSLTWKLLKGDQT